MEIQFFGANCIVITTKQVRIVIDDNLADLGAKSVLREGDVVVYTKKYAKPTIQPRLFVDMPGEYEVSDIAIEGIPARAHMDEEGQKTAVIYKIVAGDVRVAVAGHIHPDLKEKQLEQIGVVDILILPVGGNGYTLDAAGATQVAKKIEPKVVIPTHYDSSKLSFEVPQQSLEQALKAFGVEEAETVSKFKPKPADFAESMQVVVLEG